MIGITIRMGAEGFTMAAQGHSWDLRDLDRHKLSALGQMVSDTMGLTQPAKAPARGPKRSTRTGPRKGA